MKNKDRMTAILITVLSVLTALPSGILIAYIGFKSGIGVLMIYITFVLSVAIAMILQTAIHEAGHMVFGLLTGFRFISYRILSYIVIRENDRLKLSRFAIPGTLGQCLMGTPVDKDKKPYFLYNAGGVIFNLISACICYPLSLLVSNPYLAICLAVNGMYALISLFSNAIPFKGNGVANDGMNILEMTKYPDTIDCFYRMLDFYEMMNSGGRSRDIPEDVLDLRESTLTTGGLGASNIIYLENKLMDEHRFTEAEELIKDAYEKEYPLLDYHKCLLNLDQKYLDMLKCGFEDFSDKKMLKFIDSSKARMLSVVRYLYAKALYQNDRKEADNQLKTFELLEKDYPFKGECKSEKELMEIAEEKLGQTDIINKETL
ncbi:MAG: hypothetical protein IJJ00_01040 [Erysipelotrichaceae bacterium]|nr:hypothetical protein [Erysipelotrichaceae bacterium]